MFPDEFVRAHQKWDLALLVYVLQVIPIKRERGLIIDEISKKLDKTGTKRIYYAARYSDPHSELAFEDGWINGIGEHGRTF